MVELQTRETDSAPSDGGGTKPRWIVYAVLGLGAIVAVMVGVSLTGGDDDDAGGDTADSPEATEPATPEAAEPAPPVGPPEMDAEAEAALADVEAAFAAYNSGDMETWAQWRELPGEGSPFENAGDTGSSGYAYEAAAGSRFDVQPCTYRGFGSWATDDEPLTGHGFECDAMLTDSVMAAAGIELRLRYVWVIGDGPDSSAANSNEDFTINLDLHNEFYKWLGNEYPAEREAIEAVEGPDWVFPELSPVASGVPTMLERIDEFVAQSPDYPFTSPVPRLQALRLVPDGTPSGPVDQGHLDN